jgi:hypothetical protein
MSAPLFLPGLVGLHYASDDSHMSVTSKWETKNIPEINLLLHNLTYKTNVTLYKLIWQPNVTYTYQNASNPCMGIIQYKVTSLWGGYKHRNMQLIAKEGITAPLQGHLYQ